MLRFSVADFVMFCSLFFLIGFFYLHVKKVKILKCNKGKTMFIRIKKRMAHPKCDLYGFTLIELMLSLALVLIASAGTLQAIQAANVLSIEARETTIAMNDARAVLERVKITNLSALPNNTTVDASSVWADLNSFVSNSLADEQIRVTGGSGSSLRQVTVTVNWTAPRNKQKSVQFSTLKSFFNG
jgi:prepilin-type N-terminal cleavage/methylation domain-containing protein